MTEQEKCDLMQAALKEIVETARRDPNGDPEQLRKIAREALEKVEGTRRS